MQKFQWTKNTKKSKSGQKTQIVPNQSIESMPKRKKEESSSDDSDDADWEEEDDPPVKGAYTISGVRFIYIYATDACNCD